MKKPILLLLLSIVMAILGLSSVGAGTAIRVGIYQDSPLSAINRQGKAEGFFVDILAHIANQEKWDIEYVHESFNECLASLQKGEIDLLGVIAYSESRGKVFDYTYENVYTDWGRVYINRKSDIDSLLDLRNCKVAVLQNDIYFHHLRKLLSQFDIKCRFIEAFENEDVLKLVENGRCAAGLVNQLYGQRHADQYDIRPSPIILSPQKLFWAVPKEKNKELLYQLDRHLKALKADEHSLYYQSFNRWFNLGAPSVFRVWFKWTALVGLAFLALSLFVMLIFRRQVKLKTRALFDKNKELTVEIEQRRQVEQALRGSEEKYRLLIENAKDAIFITQNEVIKFVNPIALNFLGYSQKKLSETPFIEFIHPEDRERVFDRYDRRINGEEISSSVGFRVISRSGEELFVDLNAVLITWKGKPAVLNFLRDVTSQKKMEAQLQQARKMETIGTLASGVAHDLNNILSGVVSYPELLLMDMPSDNPFHKPLSTIKKSGEKAAAIVQDLLTLARRGVFVSEVVDLNQIVSESLQAPEIDKVIQYHPETRITVDLDDNLLNIKGSPVHLSKTLFNLISNAVEAMPHGGDITISTANQYIDEPVQGHDEIKQGDYVVLKVADTGIGIAAEDLEKIFEPFFTKKKMGRSGTGLGMAVVWGTVNDHKGYIDVDSQTGHGTTFSLFFPITRKVSAIGRAPLAFKDLKGGGETILVVDDVDEQREIASAILTQLGYRVTAVTGGKAAVNYLESHHADLVVLDMIMPPGIDGFETYQQIIAFNPGQKTIIASGYTETDQVKKMQQLGAGAYVKKPYTLEKIGQAVKSELGKSR